MEDELPGILDGIDEPVTVQELEDVVRRAGQRRRATLVGGAAALLALGALGGALARGPADDSSVGAAGSSSTTMAPPTNRVEQTWGASGYMEEGSGMTFTPLFRREANGVAVRAYRTTFPSPPDPVAAGRPACMPPTGFIQGELSNAGAVGIAMAPVVEGNLLGVLGMSGFGGPEGSPNLWVIVRVPGGIPKVRVTFGGASDTMVATEGIALLVLPDTKGAMAGPNPNSGGIVEGLDADGKVTSTAPLTLPAPDPACVPKPCIDLPPPPPSAPGQEANSTVAPTPPPPIPVTTIPVTTIPPPPIPVTTIPVGQPGQVPARVQTAECGSSYPPGGVPVPPNHPSPTIIQATPTPQISSQAGPTSTIAPAKAP